MKKLQVRALFVLMFLFFLGSLSGAADEPYRHLSGEKTGFECDVPTDWSEMRFRSLWFWKGPLSDAGYSPTLSVKYYQNGVDNFASAQEYIATMSGSARSDKGAAALLGVKPPPEAPPVQITAVRVADMDGSRFEMDEKFMHEDLPRRKGPRKASRYWGRIPVRHAHVVLPVKGGFWVLRFSAEIEEFKKYRPHFERFLQSFKLKGVLERQGADGGA